MQANINTSQPAAGRLSQAGAAIMALFTAVGCSFTPCGADDNTSGDPME